MPIPFILGAAALIAGGVGVKKGLDAKEDMESAKRHNESAQKIVDKVNEKLEEKKEATKESLENLGKEKIEILALSINEFVESFEKLKNIEFVETEGISELKNFKPNSNEFIALRKTSYEAKDIAVNGVAALGSGALMAFGTYNVVMGGLGGLLVTATTGTALSSLSGVAATNATLAWLGGGALSAGGFGMAGGMAVLGGLGVGPALAVGGFMMAKKAEEAWYNSLENEKKAEEYEAQCKLIMAQLDVMKKRAVKMKYILEKMDRIFIPLVDKMIPAVNELCSGKYVSKARKETLLRDYVYPCATTAKAIKAILDTSIINDKGEILDSAEKNICNAEQFLLKMERNV